MILQGLLGIASFIALAWALSENRRQVPWRTVVAGFFLQWALATLLLKLPFFRTIFAKLNDTLLALVTATESGTSLVFGYLGGAPLPFEVTGPQSSFILACRALPLVLVISALSALLFYWRVLPFVVSLVSRLLQKTMGIGGAVGVSAAANVFVGMVEAPLLVRPYLQRMSRGELFVLMSCGMATIAGTVMVLYASFIGDLVPDAMGHILTASLVNAPAAIAIAVILVPPAGTPTLGEMVAPVSAHSSMDAITEGTLAGVRLLLNIAAMLIVLVALVSLVNQVLGLLPGVGGEPVTLQRLLGYLMAPVVWLMGVPWSDAPVAGALMGTKIVLNELIAYLDMAHLANGAMSPRSALIMTYALCGFANFGSLGIMIGGLGTMAPERRAEVVGLGFKSILAGTLTTCTTGAVVGLLSVAVAETGTN